MSEDFDGREAIIEKLGSSPPSEAGHPEIAAIRARWEARQAPVYGRCDTCHGQQEMPRDYGYQTVVRLSAAPEMWRCQRCGGHIIVTVICGGEGGPSQDDDIAYLLAALLAAEARALPRQGAE